MISGANQHLGEHIGPDEVAADLWRDERLREMAPAAAAVEWLQPLRSAAEARGLT